MGLGGTWWWDWRLNLQECKMADDDKTIDRRGAGGKWPEVFSRSAAQEGGARVKCDASSVYFGPKRRHSCPQHPGPLSLSLSGSFCQFSSQQQPRSHTQFILRRFLFSQFHLNFFFSPAAGNFPLWENQMTGHAHSDSVSKTAVQRARVRVCWKQEEDLTGHLVHQKPSVSFRHQLKLKSNQKLSSIDSFTFHLSELLKLFFEIIFNLLLLFLLFYYFCFNYFFKLLL